MDTSQPSGLSLCVLLRSDLSSRLWVSQWTVPCGSALSGLGICGTAKQPIRVGRPLRLHCLSLHASVWFGRLRRTERPVIRAT